MFQHRHKSLRYVKDAVLMIIRKNRGINFQTLSEKVELIAPSKIKDSIVELALENLIDDGYIKFYDKPSRFTNMSIILQGSDNAEYRYYEITHQGESLFNNPLIVKPFRYARNKQILAFAWNHIIHPLFKFVIETNRNEKKGEVEVF